jgi:3-demethoxyubiquinol 3-hydroxylase
LKGHLERLPNGDQRTRAIVEQMKMDEASHARTATDHGAAELPLPIRLAMKLTSRVMTRTAYWV